jgi:RNA polymerase sigma factor, sigma-70 family
MAQERLSPEHQVSLATRVCAGDESAENELVALFSGRIRAMAIARTGDRQAALELAQDVMMAVVIALRNGHLRETERLAAFVHGTARNLINGHLRTRGQRPATESLSPTLAQAEQRDPVEVAERRSIVRRAIAALGTTDRRIVMMTLAEGLKSGEIAMQLGLAADVVRARKSRAVKKLIEQIKKLSRS